MRRRLAKAVALAVTALAALTACDSGGSAGGGDTEVIPTVNPADWRTASVNLLPGAAAVGANWFAYEQSRGVFHQDPPIVFAFTTAGDADELAAMAVQAYYQAVTVPPDLAARLYVDSDHHLVLAAVVALEDLRVVAKGTGVDSLQDLAGRTVLVPGEGSPSAVVLSYLLNFYGLKGQVQFEYLDGAAAVAERVAGAAQAIAVLPAAAASDLQAADSAVKAAVDLTSLWREATGQPIPAMTVAIDEDWAENYPVEYGIMMDCWEESIEVAVETPARAAPYLVQGGLIAAESDAAALVGRSGLAWLQGADAQAAVMAYLDAVYALDPALTGGSMPGDVFYFGT